MRLKGLSQTCAVARDPEVARECEVCAATCGDTVYTGDHRLARLTNRRHHVAPGVDQCGHRLDIAPIHEVRHVADVSARAEAATSSRNHDHSNGSVALELVECLGNLLPHPPGERVELFRTVERESPHAVRAVEQYVLALHATLSRIVAMP
jgi:hypothetical protein